jgi:hypothetical protein
MEVHSRDTALGCAHILRVRWVPYLETGHQHVRVLWVKVHSCDTTLGGANILRVWLGSLPGDRLPACVVAVDGSPQP